MKLSKSLLIAAVLGTTIFGACKKKGCTDVLATNYSDEAKKDDESCTYAPVIILSGAASVSVKIGDTYTDLGATATNHDGSAVTVTTDESAVNTAIAGAYTVTYTATNEYGTVTESRTVNVVVGQDNWTAANWDITHDCGTTTFPLASPPTISAGATEADLIFDSFFTAVGGTATATISGADITFPNQTINITVGDIIFSGTGTMNNTGTEFVVNYTYDNTTPVVGGSGTCTATYTKQ